MVIDQLKTPPWEIDSINVITEPMSTTNITGFFTCTRGSILVTEPRSASLKISASKRPRDSATPCGASRGGVGEAVTVVIRRTFRD